ncbi:MAG: SWIM zinc finger family protein [Corynebacterium sp.]|nr:SWIM zinc finger family protein [Corynebacterium sp.]
MRYIRKENIIYARFGRDGLSASNPEKKSKVTRTTFSAYEQLAVEQAGDRKFTRARTLVNTGKVIKFTPEPFLATFFVQGTQLDPFELIITFVPNEDQELTRAQTRAAMDDLPVPTQWNCTCPDTTDMCAHVAAALIYLREKMDSDPQVADILQDKHTLEPEPMPIEADFWLGAALPDIPSLPVKNSILHAEPKVIGHVLKNVTDSPAEAVVLRAELEEYLHRMIDLE